MSSFLRRLLALTLFLSATGYALWAQQKCACVPATGTGLAATFFGISSTLTGGSHDPTVTFAVRRMWNTSPNCGWGQTETASGVFNFTNCNAPMDQANAVGALPDFVYGRTPCWAITGGNPTCSGTPCSGVFSSSNDCAQPPNDVATTNAIVKAHVVALIAYVQGRYPGIHNWYIECVNEANLSSEWTGSMQNLADMCNAIRTQAKSIDPTIIMLGPSSSTYNKFGAGLYSLANYMGATGAANSFDAMNYHPYFFCQADLVTFFGTFSCKIPEQAILGNATLDSFRAANGLTGKQVIMSESGWGVPPANLLANMSDADREAWIGRLMMYTYNSGYAGFWSYTWDCPAGSLASCDSTMSGSTVGAGVATAWGTFRTWLLGSRHVVNSCQTNFGGSGTWYCAIISSGNAQQAILFNYTGNQTVTVSNTFTTQDNADGTNQAIVAHQVVAGAIPIRIR